MSNQLFVYCRECNKCCKAHLDKNGIIISQGLSNHLSNSNPPFCLLRYETDGLMLRQDNTATYDFSTSTELYENKQKEQHDNININKNRNTIQPTKRNCRFMTTSKIQQKKQKQNNKKGKNIHQHINDNEVIYNPRIKKTNQDEIEFSAENINTLKNNEKQTMKQTSKENEKMNTHFSNKLNERHMEWIKHQPFPPSPQLHTEISLINLMNQHKMPLTAFKSIMQWAQTATTKFKFDFASPIRTHETIINDL